ncbi:hypothetical protein BDV3_004074 [Batrachochytrium dendrobatidis]|uniref:Alpha-tubulin N-acetyltransferase n=1 Tax=Batrachochytrium dendrobatidis (strain JEL423) TaxID=403673 RepID=A0A177WGA1_BATDL|nr:hypothetical protein BDEG_22451 [Batrachochytrium dendrobatidis JEL423]
MEFKFNVLDVIRKPISIFSSTELPKSQQALEKIVEIIDEVGIASAKAQGLRAPVTSILKLKHNPNQRIYIMRTDFDAKHNTKTGDQDSTDTLQSHQSKSMSESLDFHFNAVGLAKYSQLIDSRKQVVVGLLKVGLKKLFLVDEFGRQIEINALCVLDFYIHESSQRLGYGKRLFEYMLAIEFCSASELCYDRPSSKFLAFLKKHYDLHESIPQSNYFTVFKQFGLGLLELDSKGRPKPPLKLNPILKNTKHAHPTHPTPILRSEGLLQKFQHMTKNAPPITVKQLPSGNSINNPYDIMNIGSLTDKSAAQNNLNITSLYNTGSTKKFETQEHALLYQTQEIQPFKKQSKHEDNLHANNHDIFPPNSTFKETNMLNRSHHSKDKLSKLEVLSDEPHQHYNHSHHSHHHTHGHHTHHTLAKTVEHQTAQAQNEFTKNDIRYKNSTQHMGENENHAFLENPCSPKSQGTKSSSRFNRTQVVEKVASQAMVQEGTRQAGVLSRNDSKDILHLSEIGPYDSRVKKQHLDSIPIDPIDGPIDWTTTPHAGQTVSATMACFKTSPEIGIQEKERKARIRMLMQTERLPLLSPSALGNACVMPKPYLSGIALLAGGLGSFEKNYINTQRSEKHRQRLVKQSHNTKDF